jgi:hypothetical protein
MPAFRAFQRSDDVDDQDYSGDRRAPNPERDDADLPIWRAERGAPFGAVMMVWSVPLIPSSSTLVLLAAPATVARSYA